MNRTTVDAARSLGISTTRFNEIAAEESVETPSKRRKRETRTEKDLDIIKRQTAEIERLHMQMKTKPLWAELERAADRIRELEAMLREIVEDSCPYDDSDDVVLAQPVSNEKLNRAEALLAASPEAAGRLPGAVLQANSDGTISKVDPDPLTAQDKSSIIQWLREMADKLEGKECEQST